MVNIKRGQIQRNDLSQPLWWAELTVPPHHQSGPFLEGRVNLVLFGWHLKCVFPPTALKVQCDYYHFADIISISQIRKWRLRKVVINK